MSIDDALGEDEQAKVDENQPEPEELETSEGEGEEQSTEVEVVRETAAGSQPDRQQGIRRRINKLNEKVKVAETATDDVLVENERLRQANQIYALAAQQQQEKIQPPDPLDFNGGVADPEYAAALRTFNQPAIDDAVKRHVTAIEAERPRVPSPDIERNQRKHYEKAGELGVKDFDEMEDVAIGILGKDNANHIIQNFDNSPHLLWYFGKHPNEAQNIRDLIETNPLKAVAALGRLEGELSVKPRAKVEPASEPDVDLTGTSPTAANPKSNRLQRKLDKAREAARSGGTMVDVMAIKREAKEAGVTVI